MSRIRCYASAVLVCSTLACSSSSNLPSSEKPLEEESATDGKEYPLELVTHLLDRYEIEIDNESTVRAMNLAYAASKTKVETEAEWAAEPKTVLAPLLTSYVTSDELQQLAGAELAWAQYDLGDRYLSGREVLQDFEKAEYWIRLAGEQGYVPAIINLRVLYYEGKIFSQSDEEAVYWARQAAEKGNADHTFLIGSLFHQGLQVPQDASEAMRWLERAAEKGSAKAMNRLGLMYLEEVVDWGWPVQSPSVPQQNDVLAYMWFNLARLHSPADVRNDLGWLPDDSAALANLSLRTEIESNRDGVLDRLTQVEIREAQQLAREWDAAHPRKP